MLYVPRDVMKDIDTAVEPNNTLMAGINENTAITEEAKKDIHPAFFG